MVEIKITLDKIIAILNYVGEKNWCNIMKNFRERCELLDIESRRNLLSDIMGIYGGMGSFSDLVLYENGNLLIDKNSSLNELRKKLFDLVKQIY